ncbi:hypothetical protein ACLG6S_07495 [Thermodesulfobacteriota bacterium B35]
MRARLEQQAPGAEFRFLCDRKMARRMAPVILEANGEIVERDDRSYGVVFLVRKR